MGFKKYLLFVSGFAAALHAYSDEGMWLPSLLNHVNIAEMQNLGAKISKDDIYNINTSSFKDAVLAIDHGSCTGELISPDGLFFTNHHCAYSEIQEHSCEADNYLRDGFWAKNREEELPNPGKTVSFLIRVEDVTERVLEPVTNEMSEDVRNDSIISRIVKIEREVRQDTHYDVNVEGMFESNRYYLFVYETFKDVRLVGAPPRFIGKFGGDTDNWMWPRHTGDFALFRIYTAPDGKPAEFSKENIPLKSKHYFPISLKGYDKDDFSMVMGFPGTTNRYLTADGVNEIMQATNQARIRIRAEKLRILRDFMQSSEKANIQYASKYAQSSNYYKYSIGQNQGLERLKVVEKKQALENQFEQWTTVDTARVRKFERALPILTEAYKNMEANRAQQFLSEAFLRGPEIFMVAYRFRSLSDEIKDSRRKDMIYNSLDKLTSRMKEHFRDYDAETDRKLVATLTQIYAEEVPVQYHPKFLQTIQRKYKNDYEEWSKEIFAGSIFDNEETVLRFLSNPKPKVIQRDAVFQVSKQIFEMYSKLNSVISKKNVKLNEGYRLYYAGLMEMNPDARLYPDANSTLRVTYGQIGDYSPGDAIHFNYYTTIDGYLEKAIPGDFDFDVSPGFKELILSDDYGDYLDSDGKLHTCFISNNDITGGNSGSPVLNGNGELIGIAFDGNWEAMSGDIAFEPDFQKCINVDIRFVLWVIDRYAGAKHLIDEMTIRK